MMWHKVFAALAALALALLIVAAHAATPLPPGGQRVTDLTNTLSSTDRYALERKLGELEQATGAQVVVLLVRSTGAESIEAYALRIAEAWKPGRHKVDDGVVFVLAKDDRKVRLEVGYGLEGAIPDAVAKHILAERVTPLLKQGRYYDGLAAGVDAVAARVVAEANARTTPALARSPASADLRGTIREGVLVALVAVLLATVGGGLALASKRGRDRDQRRQREAELAAMQARWAQQRQAAAAISKWGSTGVTEPAIRQASRSSAPPTTRSTTPARSADSAPHTPSWRHDDAPATASSSFSGGGGSFGGGGASDSY